MATPSNRLITVEEYERMIENGLLTEDDRVELLEGEIVEMSPIGLSHVTCLSNLTEILITGKPRDVVVSPGGPLVLSDISEPEPDLTLYRTRPPGARNRHPDAGQVLLTIEVADSSLAKDLHRKRRLYAVEEVFVPGQSLAPTALPDLIVNVDAIFEPR